MKHFDWAEEDKETKQQEELWLGLVRDEEVMITFFYSQLGQVFWLESEPSGRCPN